MRKIRIMWAASIEQLAAGLSYNLENLVMMLFLRELLRNSIFPFRPSHLPIPSNLIWIVLMSISQSVYWTSSFCHFHELIFIFHRQTKGNWFFLGQIYQCAENTKLRYSVSFQLPTHHPSQTRTIHTHSKGSGLRKRKKIFGETVTGEKETKYIFY